MSPAGTQPHRRRAALTVTAALLAFRAGLVPVLLRRGHATVRGPLRVTSDASTTFINTNLSPRRTTLLCCHPGQIASLAWSPGGRHIATGGHDGRVLIHHASTGVVVQTLAAHLTEVREIAWSPDGTSIASLGFDAVRVWDPTTGREVSALGPSPRTPHLPVFGSWTMSWSPDGRYLAVGESTEPSGCGVDARRRRHGRSAGCATCLRCDGRRRECVSRRRRIVMLVSGSGM